MSKRRKQPRGEPLRPIVRQCEDTQGADVAEVMNAERDRQINALVDSFLAWPLPQSVCSDLCVTDSAYRFPRYGTSLLSATEARAMIEYLIAGSRGAPLRAVR